MDTPMDRRSDEERRLAESGHHCPSCDAAAHRRPEPAAGNALTRRALLQFGGALGVGALVAHSGIAGAARLAERAFDLSGATRTAAVWDPAWPPVRVVTRAGWGCDERRRESGQVYDAQIDKIVVHHTATPNGADAAATVRGVFNYHVSGEYIDIAYHWLIGPDGTVYEGRWARDYPNGTPHVGENEAGQNVRGGHALGHNTNTIGIALLGTFTSARPTDAAVRSLVRLIAWKCARWGIDPLGSTSYLNGFGQTETFPNICGHRDVRSTECPGNGLATLLPAVRGYVQHELQHGISGYWMIDRSGDFRRFGDVAKVGGPPVGGPNNWIDALGHPSGRGYWLLDSAGTVGAFGAAQHYGNLPAGSPAAVAMATTPAGKGYWIAGVDGRVSAFGRARSFGSVRAGSLSAPVRAIVPTPSGKGYHVVAGDGAVLSFGDALFRGSASRTELDSPVVGMARTPTGTGYWLVCRSGRVLPFGDARPLGWRPQREAVRGIVASLTGKGYAVFTRDGHLERYGDFPDHGDAQGLLGDTIGVAGRFAPVD